MLEQSDQRQVATYPGVAATHNTAETQPLDVDGVRFAYRRFGAPIGTPLMLLQHFRGNIDGWDPALTDALARGREIILVDYPGAGSSSGRVRADDR